MKIMGGCHCGNIEYEFGSEMEFDELPIRICGCSYCSKHGNRYTSDSAGQLRVGIARPDDITKYQFASKTTDWVFCAICGVMPFIKLHADNRIFAIININTADQNFDMTKAQRFDYSTETIRESIDRRKKNWIGNVAIKTSLNKVATA